MNNLTYINKSTKDIIWVCDYHTIPQYDMGVIYQMYCIDSGKSYMGQTRYFYDGNRPNGPLKRAELHIKEAYSKNPGSVALNNAIRKYGANRFMLFIVHECKIEELDAAETLYIELFDTLAPNGYNLTSGGRHAGLNLFAETKKKLVKLVEVNQKRK